MPNPTAIENEKVEYFDDYYIQLELLHPQRKFHKITAEDVSKMPDLKQEGYTKMPLTTVHIQANIIYLIKIDRI